MKIDIIGVIISWWVQMIFFYMYSHEAVEADTITVLWDSQRLLDHRHQVTALSNTGRLTSWGAHVWFAGLYCVAYMWGVGGGGGGWLSPSGENRGSMLPAMESLLAQGHMLYILYWFWMRPNLRHPVLNSTRCVDSLMSVLSQLLSCEEMQGVTLCYTPSFQAVLVNIGGCIQDETLSGVTQIGHSGWYSLRAGT